MCDEVEKYFVTDEMHESKNVTEKTMCNSKNTIDSSDCESKLNSDDITDIYSYLTSEENYVNMRY